MSEGFIDIEGRVVFRDGAPARSLRTCYVLLGGKYVLEGYSVSFGTKEMQFEPTRLYIRIPTVANTSRMFPKAYKRYPVVREASNVWRAYASNYISRFTDDMVGECTLVEDLEDAFPSFAEFNDQEVINDLLSSGGIPFRHIRPF